MKLRRHHAIRVVAAAAVALATSSMLGITNVSATVPPTTPPTDSSVPADGQAPATDDQQFEIVQSWTLTPGGGAAGDDASNRPDLTYQIAPGTQIDDTVILYNYSNVPMLFRVYATDAFNNDDGQFDLIPGAEVPTDAGSWISLAQEDITLEPGKQVTIPFTLRVPIDATPGDHVGAVVAANINTADNGDGQVIDVERRTGTRLYVQVDGPLNPELSVVDLTTEYHHAVNSLAGSADISFTVENRGNVRLGGVPVVEMSGPFGIGKKSVTLDEIVELLPGEKIELAAELDGVPALFLDTTTVTIEAVDRAERSEVEPVKTKDRLFVPPVFFLLVLAVVILGVLARRAYLRRKRAALPVAPLGSGSGIDDPALDEMQSLAPQSR